MTEIELDDYNWVVSTRHCFYSPFVWDMFMRPFMRAVNDNGGEDD